MSVVGYFDTIYGASLFGWAYDQSNSSRRLLLEAVMENGQVLGSSRADVFRGDLLKAGLGDGKHSFKIDLSGNVADLVERTVGGRIVGREAASPRGCFRNS